MSTDLLTHATGLCALVLNVLALARTCEKSLRVQSSIAGMIWSLNNLLLGAHAAAAISLVSAGRTAASAATVRGSASMRRAAFVGFFLLTAAISLVTWHGPASILLALASVLSTYGMFYMHGRRLRWSMLIVSALWMHNAWLYGSWEQMLANMLTAAAAVYGAARVAKTGAPRA